MQNAQTIASGPTPTVTLNAGAHTIQLVVSDGKAESTDTVQVTIADGDGDAIADACDACPQDRENDADRDGICGNLDLCPGTVLPETVPTVELRYLRYADVNGDGVFDTIFPPGQVPVRHYTMNDTAGCSCTQVIEALSLGDDHRRFGCSISAMDDWLAHVSSASLQR